MTTKKQILETIEKLKQLNEMGDTGQNINKIKNDARKKIEKQQAKQQNMLLQTGQQPKPNVKTPQQVQQPVKPKTKVNLTYSQNQRNDLKQLSKNDDNTIRDRLSNNDFDETGSIKGGPSEYQNKILRSKVKGSNVRVIHTPEGKVLKVAKRTGNDAVDYNWNELADLYKKSNIKENQSLPIGMKKINTMNEWMSIQNERYERFGKYLFETFDLFMEDMYKTKSSDENSELLENNISTAVKQFVDTDMIDKFELNAIIRIDPSPTKKYVYRIANWYVNDYGIHFGNVEEYINMFEDYTKRGIIKPPYNDIGRYKTFDDLTNFIDGLENTKSNTEIENAVKRGEVEEIYENDDWIVIQPLSEQAARIYGSGTRWCISGHTNNQWNSYVEQGATIYFAISKIKRNDRKNKIAVIVYLDNRIECRDEIDCEINFNVFANLTGINRRVFN